MNDALTRGTVVSTASVDDLALIRRREVVAVIQAPIRLPAWFGEVQRAVASGAVRVERVITPAMSPSHLRRSLHRLLPEKGWRKDVRDALYEDAADQIELCGRLSSATRLQLRVMTATPDRRHGFHVDLSPRDRATRTLKVYGPGTEWVRTEDVTGCRGLLLYVHQRERLARALDRPSLTRRDRARLGASLERLDRRPPSSVRAR